MNRNTLYIALFLLFVLLMWSTVSSVAKPPNLRAVLTDQILDLSGEVLDKAIYYCDDFENYPQKLYTPNDFETGSVTEPPQHLTLADYREINYATHRMLVKLTLGKVYGIFLRSSDYSMRLFINADEVEPVGWPGDTKESTVPRVAERVYYFKPDAEITTFIMQAANFVHREGAYPSLMHFGTYEIISRYTMIKLVTATLITGCLLTAFLYHFGLFCLNRKRKTVLIFSICCMLLAMMNNKLIPLLKLVGQLLHITRIQESRASLHPVDFCEIASHSINAFRAASAANSNRLVLKAEPGIPPVAADETTLSQLLSNLFSNANAHTKNGEITITANTEPTGAFAQIAVTDTGCGISPDFLSQVFERYRTKSESGTGLGLAICKEIIDFHGGEITVESELLKGTTERFTLPFVKGDNANGSSHAGFIC